MNTYRIEHMTAEPETWKACIPGVKVTGLHSAIMYAADSSARAGGNWRIVEVETGRVVWVGCTTETADRWVRLVPT